MAYSSSFSRGVAVPLEGEAGQFGAGALDVVDGLRGAGGEDLAAGLRDQHVVLDADADAAERGGHGVGDRRRRGLLFVLQALGGGHAETEAAVPHLFFAVLAKHEGDGLALGIEVEARLHGDDGG